MKSNDPIDLLKEKARRAANRYAKLRRYSFTALGVLALGASLYFFQNLPEQKFVNAHINDTVGSISIRGDYTDFWEVTENESPERDLFQGWPPEFILPASLDRCGDRFAILVHEPHGNQREEWQLFYLLWYLQRDYPRDFSNLVVFQEGSLAEFPENRSLIANHNRSEIVGNRFFEFREREFGASFFWVENRLFETNEATYGDGLTQILSTAKRFGDQQPSDDWINAATQSFLFDSKKNRNGSIDTQGSFFQVIHRSDLEGKDDVLEKLKLVQSRHANLAKFLIDDIHLRAAFAYEIFSEGFSENPNNTVDVFGIEDPILYGASCRLFPGCNGDGRKNVKWEDSPQYFDWGAIQPYRHAIMANNILNVLRTQVPKDTIPVITAAIHGHLPELRGYLCEAGYDTVGLNPTQNTARDLQQFEAKAAKLLEARGTTQLFSTTIRNSDIVRLRNILDRSGWLKSRPQ